MNQAGSGMTRMGRWGSATLGLAVMVLGACGDGWSENRQDGLECRWGAQCDGQVCLTSTLAGVPTGWEGGMCTRLCSTGVCPQDESCTNLGDGLYCLPKCENGQECRSGYVCDNRLEVCLPSCVVAGCPQGYACDEAGLCQFDWSGLGDVGQECDGDAECRSGFCIPSMEGGVFTGWTGGMCTDVCGGKECPQGASCVILSGEPWCLPSCGPELGCREGYVCRDDWQACLPDCTLGWLCGEGFLCMADGKCEVILPELAPVGSGCGVDSDCADGWCLEEVDPQMGPTGWVGGSCSMPCGAGIGCSAGTACVVLEAAGWCLPPCGAMGQPECREGYVCDPYLHACLPNCANEGWSCGMQYTCRSDGVCGTPFP